MTGAHKIRLECLKVNQIHLRAAHDLSSHLSRDDAKLRLSISKSSLTVHLFLDAVPVAKNMLHLRRSEIHILQDHGV